MGNLTNCPGKLSLRLPITGLRSHSLPTLPTGNAGRNRHESASKVSAPADIQVGDAVADERPSELSDALSVRNKENISKADTNALAIRAGGLKAWAKVRHEEWLRQIQEH